jgi:hypothetical protein
MIDIYRNKRFILTSIVVIFVLSTLNFIPLSFEVVLRTSDKTTNSGMGNSLTDMKAAVKSNIDNATYFTIKNATTPAVAIDPTSSTAYAVYFRGENGGGNIYLQKSDDFGKTFSSPIRVNNIMGEVQLDAQWSPPALGVGPNSEVYVVWYNANHSEPEKYPYGLVTMRFARSLDGGNTFQPAINPAPHDPKGEQSYPFMTVSKDNRIYISYLNLDYAKVEDNAGTPTVFRIVSSSDGGKTFAPSTIADKTACQCCATVTALGPEGELYASTRSVFKNASQTVDNETKTDYYNNEEQIAVIRDITVEHSLDNGSAKVFSEPSRVGRDNWFMNGCPDAGPGMAFDSKGRMHLAWFTGSETASQGQGFYYTSSDDKGTTFSKPVPIHLLSEQWIPPTTQYLTTDSHDNSWIVFVNSEGLQKSADYEETFEYEGDGTVQLTVIDRDGNIIQNGPFASGNITKHYPYTSGINGDIAISWIDGDDVKLAFIDTNKS